MSLGVRAIHPSRGRCLSRARAAVVHRTYIKDIKNDRRGGDAEGWGRGAGEESGALRALMHREKNYSVYFVNNIPLGTVCATRRRRRR